MHPDNPPASGDPASSVLRVAQIGFDAPAALLGRFGLQLRRVAPGEPIPGSFWGDEEAGIIGSTVYARDDTPVHSLLHEAGHLIVLPPEDVRTSIPTPPTRSRKRTPPATCRSCWPTNCPGWVASA
ncbi:hypothetical protein RLIN73S_01694 [Rhodanobacter lindaniclasticus]